MTKVLPPPIRNLAERARDLRRKAVDSSQWLASFSQAEVMEDAIPFQDPIDEICAERPPRFLRGVHYVIMVMFIVIVVTASVVKVDTVVVGTGRLTTANPPVMLQPLDQGIIRELNVKEGDAVHKGEVLATLDPTFAKADLATLSSQQRLLVAQVDRLQAEVDNHPFVVAPNATSEEKLQQSLFDQRHAQYESQLRVYDEGIEQRKAGLKATESDRDKLAQQLDLSKQVEAMRATMLEKQIGSKLNYVQAQADRVRIDQSYQDAVDHMTELQHDLQSQQAQREAFINDWRNRTLESLVNARNDAAKTTEGIAKASLVNDLVVVTSPVDGVVLDVAKLSVGSVVRAAEPLVTIVQSNAELVGEIMISSTDIGYTHAGEDVVVKVDAFPYQIHGMLKGRLMSVSEESFGSNTPTNANDDMTSATTHSGGGAFHRGLVELEGTKLENLPEGSRLIPGMTMSAEIKVGSRSVMSYFLYPITRGLKESIREP